MYTPVNPIVDPAVRQMCRLPYHGHPKGCPCYNHKHGCPPEASLLRTDNLDWWAVFTQFRLDDHVARMRVRHPNWSIRQLQCCLYWQAGARRQLIVEVNHFRKQHPLGSVYLCPEAWGVNVTDTMAAAGIPVRTTVGPEGAT